MLEYSVIEDSSLAAAIVTLNKFAAEGWRLDQALWVPASERTWLWLLIIHRLVFEEPEEKDDG